MPMKATGAKAPEIVDLVEKCGVLIAKEKDRFVQREALAELVSMLLLPLPETEWEAVLANLTNTARGLAKLRAR
jgi:hypothetical protein